MTEYVLKWTKSRIELYAGGKLFDVRDMTLVKDFTGPFHVAVFLWPSRASSFTGQEYVFKKNSRTLIDAFKYTPGENCDPLDAIGSNDGSERYF